MTGNREIAAACRRVNAELATLPSELAAGLDLDSPWRALRLVLADPDRNEADTLAAIEAYEATCLGLVEAAREWSGT